MAKKRTTGRKGAPNQRLDPDLAMLMQLVELEKHAEVEVAARRILDRRLHPLAMKALSFALIGQERYLEGLAVADHALLVAPHDPELHSNRGIAQFALARREESAESFRRAIELDPSNHLYYKHLGNAYAGLSNRLEAIRCYSMAIEIGPEDDQETVASLVQVMLDERRYEQAYICAEAMVEDGDAGAALLYAKVQASLLLGRWKGLSAEINTLISKFIRESCELDGTPLRLASVPGISRADHHAVTANFARTRVPPPQRICRPVLPYAGGHRHPGPLRVGFASPDFREHPVGRVVAELLERLDKSRFTLFAYSLSKDQSAIRERLLKAFHHVRDLESRWISENIERVRGDQLDVLVDLGGYTLDAEPELFAARCAPVQATWVGYPGTMAIPGCYDYLIGDPVVTPVEHADDYDERLALLPACYLPADTTRLPGKVPDRSAAGLPEAGFVFGSHNAGYKLNPQVFDTWCELLRKVDGSVLWLSSQGASFEDSLRMEAEARGVSGSRLVFAPRLRDHADHLDRLQLIDLALDPFPYNSHSTGIDVLWAGVPLVALSGEILAARVGASLLRNVGLDQLVAGSVSEYVEIALALARDRERLAGLRQHLAVQRTRLPLFDMATYAERVGALFTRMVADAEAGRIVHILPNDY